MDVASNSYLLSVVNELHYDRVKRDNQEFNEYAGQVKDIKIKEAQRELRGGK